MPMLLWKMCDLQWLSHDVPKLDGSEKTWNLEGGIAFEDE
jgi:hypothetical protein